MNCMKPSGIVDGGYIYGYMWHTELRLFGKKDLRKSTRGNREIYRENKI